VVFGKSEDRFEVDNKDSYSLLLDSYTFSLLTLYFNEEDTISNYREIIRFEEHNED
jgi:hypothetical protein